MRQIFFVPSRAYLILSLSKDASWICSGAVLAKPVAVFCTATACPSASVGRSRLGAACGGRYIETMAYVFPILVLLAMLGALGALALGVINMARGNNPQRSNRLMQSRVMLQALALLLFAIFMLLFHH
jgi:hypothetical protein